MNGRDSDICEQNIYGIMTEYDILLSFEGDVTKEDLDVMVYDMQMISALNVASRAILENQDNMRFAKEYMSRTKINVLPGSNFPEAVYLDVVPPKLRGISDMHQFMSAVMYFVCDALDKIKNGRYDDNGADRRINHDISALLDRGVKLTIEVRGIRFVFEK